MNDFCYFICIMILSMHRILQDNLLSLIAYDHWPYLTNEMNGVLGHDSAL